MKPWKKHILFFFGNILFLGYFYLALRHHTPHSELRSLGYNEMVFKYRNEALRGDVHYREKRS